MNVCDGAGRSIFSRSLRTSVDGAVAARLAAAPQALHQLVARDDAAALAGERVEQAELGWRQLGAAAVDERLHDLGSMRDSSISVVKIASPSGERRSVLRCVQWERAPIASAG